MKMIKALMLSAVLFFAPTAALAGVLNGVIPGDFLDDAAPAIPEPSGMLVMGVALATVALVVRRQRQ